MNRLSVLGKNDRRRAYGVSRRVTIWARQNGRAFPWREDRMDYYALIVVEVLLQRTRAETVAGIWSSFIEAFPDWGSLVKASNSQLGEIIKPLGLWRRRTRSLKDLARSMEALSGTFPTERPEIDDLPAVGQYVANAIELFVHGRPKPLLDTNMARILERYFRPRELADLRYDPWLQELAHALVATSDPAFVNWAMLDLGALICKPKLPICTECPLNRGCSYRSSMQSEN